MLSLPAAILTELNTLNQSGALIYLVSVPNRGQYYARSRSDITWNSQTWHKSWFEIDGIGEDSGTHAPELQISVSNIGGAIEADIIAHGNYSKDEIHIYAVNTNCLSETTPVFHVKLQILKVTCNRKAAVFKIGLNNPLLMAFPSWKTHDSICQYAEFKGTLCGYSGGLTTCNRTLADCLVRANTERFGAQLGIQGAIQND